MSRFLEASSTKNFAVIGGFNFRFEEALAVNYQAKFLNMDGRTEIAKLKDVGIKVLTMSNFNMSDA